jgi:hypothetical protein
MAEPNLATDRIENALPKCADCKQDTIQLAVPLRRDKLEPQAMDSKMDISDPKLLRQNMLIPLPKRLTLRELKLEPHV